MAPKSKKYSKQLFTVYAFDFYCCALYNDGVRNKQTSRAWRYKNSHWTYLEIFALSRCSLYLSALLYM